MNYYLPHLPLLKAVKSIISDTSYANLERSISEDYLFIKVPSEEALAFHKAIWGVHRLGIIYAIFNYEIVTAEEALFNPSTILIIKQDAIPWDAFSHRK